MFGKLYTFFAIKTVFMATVLLFEIGSAICGAAPNSAVFIVGRAIAGVGAAGIFSGVVSTSNPLARLKLADDENRLSSLFMLCRCTNARYIRGCLAQSLDSHQ